MWYARGDVTWWWWRRIREVSWWWWRRRQIRGGRLAPPATLVSSDKMTMLSCDKKTRWKCNQMVAFWIQSRGWTLDRHFTQIGIDCPGWKDILWPAVGLFGNLSTEKEWRQCLDGSARQSISGCQSVAACSTNSPVFSVSQTMFLHYGYIFRLAEKFFMFVCSFSQVWVDEGRGGELGKI